jgi:hypothetical protein
MRMWRFLMLISCIGGWMLPSYLLAQEPSGVIGADPNPCRIEPGRTQCTAHITWQTQGVQHAKVFVTAEGKHRIVEHEFGDGVVCEGRRCRAPWIAEDTRYVFQLFDFSRGDRGRLLGSVTVTAQ